MPTMPLAEIRWCKTHEQAKTVSSGFGPFPEQCHLRFTGQCEMIDAEVYPKGDVIVLEHLAWAEA